MTKAEIVANYAIHFIGINYKWGGSSPLEGLDCSGAVQEWLAAVGKDPMGDQTAQSLYDILKVYCKEGIIQQGTVLFFGKSKKEITHVAIAWDKEHMIEAGGGGSRTLTREDAIRDKAFVRMRPIRKDLVAYLNID